MSAFAIRRLAPADAAAFRHIRLEALHTHPEAFASSVQEEAGLSLAAVAARIPASGPGAVFAGEAGGRLAGMVGLAVPDRPKLRHRGTVWGMYARADARGSGLGAALLTRLIGHARADGTLSQLHLSVVTENAPARRLYDRFGFRAFAIDRRALRMPDGRELDEELRVLEL